MLWVDATAPLLRATIIAVLIKPERCHARGMMEWLSQYGKDGCL
jgi:hypothetical protein